MKRSIASIAACIALIFALMVCVFATGAPTVGAHATSSGSISGAIVNATHQSAVVANQKVTLQRSTGGVTQDIATTVTDSTGRFAFLNLPINTSDTYAVYTQFQGGMFSSQLVSVGDSAGSALQLKVYDTTNDDTNLRVTVATLLVRQPRPVNGLISLGEIVSIENTGTTAFVGTPTGDASKPMRLLRFATPMNASNLSLGIGFAGSQIITTDKGFGSTATVPPGTTEFAFAIDIPYTGTAADLAYESVYPATRVVVLVPPSMFVNGEDFVDQGLIDSLGARYQLYTLANAAAGKQNSLQLTNLPQAGEKSYLDAHALAILAAILALLALLALVFYLRRGDIASALGLVPMRMLAGQSSAASHADAAVSIEAGERERLLQELLTLERAHSTGTVADKEYRQRERELRLRLRELLASEQADVSLRSVAGESVGTASVPMAEGDTKDVTASQEAASEQSSGGRR